MGNSPSSRNNSSDGGVGGNHDHSFNYFKCDHMSPNGTPLPGCGVAFGDATCSDSYRGRGSDSYRGRGSRSENSGGRANITGSAIMYTLPTSQGQTYERVAPNKTISEKSFGVTAEYSICTPTPYAQVCISSSFSCSGPLTLSAQAFGCSVSIQSDGQPDFPYPRD